MPTLFRHPQSPPLAVSGLSVEVSPSADGDLLLSYELIADCAHLRLPPPLPTERLDGLWKHTCFELFAMSVDGAYREFNFSPAGHWQAYAFTSYRQGGRLEPAQAPHIEADRTDTRLRVKVRLPAANLPAGPRLRLGLTAVLEASDGRLAYWALRHAAGQADFHRADTFALDLDLNHSGTPA
jgi:hypothetical protein